MQNSSRVINSHDYKTQWHRRPQDCSWLISHHPFRPTHTHTINSGSYPAQIAQVAGQKPSAAAGKIRDNRQNKEGGKHCNEEAFTEGSVHHSYEP